MNSGLDTNTRERLRWTQLMALLTDAQFDWLVGHAEVVKCPLGEIVSSSSEEACSILVAGSVRLLVLDKQRNESTLCTFMSAGSFWSCQLLRASGQLQPLLRASDDSIYLRVSKALMTEIASKCPQLLAALERESSVLSWFSILKRTARFQDLGFNNLKPFLNQAVHKQFLSGERFTDTEAENQLFILLSGEIKAEQNGSSFTLHGGDWFTHGRLAPFQSGGHENVEAVEPGELLKISEHTYKEIREVQPELTSGFENALQRDGLKKSDARVQADLIARVEMDRRIQEEPEAQPDTPVAEGLVPKLRRSLRKYPIVYQRSELECGITCLHMICLFFGKTVSLSQLREMCEIGRGGTSMAELSEAAEQLGFFSRGVHTTYSGLMKLKLPLICFWKQNHFVVLYEINAAYAMVGDPGTGLERIERDVFSRDFSNNAIELVPSLEFGKNIESRPFFGTFKP
ncbi:MAG: hypothetical protein K2Z81_07540, partial [Cyanobacteria bacterium]|nr:hypothetical protein [Cyanobacteriota bacterium]